VSQSRYPSPLGKGLTIDLLKVKCHVYGAGCRYVAAYSKSIGSCLTQNSDALRIEPSGNKDAHMIKPFLVKACSDLLYQVGGDPPPRSPGVSRRTPPRSLPSASATRSVSSASSLKVSTSTVRGASGGINSL
jgi:hypothetical protein